MEELINLSGPLQISLVSLPVRRFLKFCVLSFTRLIPLWNFARKSPKFFRCLGRKCENNQIASDTELIIELIEFVFFSYASCKMEKYAPLS